MMNRQVIGAASGVLICTAVVTLEQPSPPVVQSSTRRFAPSTAREKEISAERSRLEGAAAALLDTGDYAEAEAGARQALSWGLGSGKGQEILASALNAQGKTEEAIQAYKVIADQGDVAPRNILPYALLLLKMGHWAQAVAAYNKQLPYLADGNLMAVNSHFSPTVPQPRELATAIHIALGLTYGASASWGRHSQDDKALAHFQQALTLAPDSSLAHLYYARKLQHLGRRAEAQAAFTKAAELGNGNVKAAAEQALRQ